MGAGVAARTLRRAQHTARRPHASIRGSAQVALDGALRPRRRLVRITARVSERVALAQEVPALVELGLDLPEARVLFVCRDLAGGQLLAQGALGADQLAEDRK